MTIEFDSNMTSGTFPVDYQTTISTGNITLTVNDATSSSIKLLTQDGDFIGEDSTNASNAQLTVSLHKADAVTLTALSRLELLGNFKLEVRKVMHRREEKKSYVVVVSQ